ncbi:MAG: hypothetical protein ACRD6X_12980 [Pyrinomonadaceae bacterium]
MRIRTQLIIEDEIMEKIDEIAGEKHLRARVVETALREFIARQGKKSKSEPKAKPANGKSASKGRGKSGPRASV